MLKFCIKTKQNKQVLFFLLYISSINERNLGWVRILTTLNYAEKNQTVPETKKKGGKQLLTSAKGKKILIKDSIPKNGQNSAKK